MSGKNLSATAATFRRQIVGAIDNAGDLRSRLRLTSDILTTKLMRLGVWRSNEPQRTIRHRTGVQITYRLNRGDIWILHEIWSQETYDVCSRKFDVLIDLGANIGVASVALATATNAARVIAVEPCAQNAALLRRNLADNGIRGEVYEAAVGSHDGTTFFAPSPSSGTGHLLSGVDVAEGRAKGAKEVRLISMPTIMRLVEETETRVLLKVDIEGSEQELFSGDVSWLSRIHTIVIEFHPTRIDYPGVIETLKRSGFGVTRSKYCGSDVVQTLCRGNG